METKMNIINNLSQEQLKELISKSTSTSDMIRNLGIQPRGCYIKLINKNMDKYNLEPPNYKDYIPKGKKIVIADTDAFVNGSVCDRKSLIKRLLKASLIENECAICKLGPVWEEEKLVLQLDHINGINNDNRVENLRLVCPNCHSQTATFSGRNQRKMRKCVCGNDIWGKYDKCDTCYIKSGKRINIRQKNNKCECGEIIYNGAKRCDPCARNNSRVFNVTKEELHDLINNQKLSFVEIGKRFNVSDSAIRQRCKILDVKRPIRKTYTRKIPKIDPNIILNNDNESLVNLP